MSKPDWDGEGWDRGVDLVQAVAAVEGVDYQDPSITRFTFEHLRGTVAQSLKRLQTIQRQLREVEKKREFE